MPSDFPPSTYDPHETLIKGIEARDAIQEQIDALNRFCDFTTKELPAGIGEAQADYLRSIQMPDLENRLKLAEMNISAIQKTLESAGRE